MEEVVSLQYQKKSSQFTGRKFSPSASKDLWNVVREGTATEVESALALLKKNGGNINLRNTFGLSPLHIATWRNHVPIVKRLLAAGADPNARDGESGWSSLHRAFHFGHLAVASILLQAGASTTLEDSKFRTPVDLLSGPVLKGVGIGNDSVATELYSWGSGVNYQLGTGNAHIQKLPCKIDSLHGSLIRFISASKFHSVAVSACGEVFTWGFGRGGRLGHPDFDIHSGQAAIITPRLVTSGLGHRRVKSIAAAKHHTVASTESGEVFTWGSNREGQLGYTSVDTQPTPRRVSSLKSKIVGVTAANKHSAVVSESGEVFTWGCNKEGQLGYGTSNSASNYTPRLVDYLKGKVFVGVSAAKYHTIVLGADGEVFTWGHRLVTPKRVIIARNLKKSGSSLLKFHRKERLHVVAIAAGVVHSLALTSDGALFYWVSSDPDLRCQQLYSLFGKPISSVSTGKYWTAAATTTGDVYMWDGKKGKEEPPVATRLHGVKRATSVSVGETHLLIIGSLYHPVYPSSIVKSNQKTESKVYSDLDELDEDFMYNDVEPEKIPPTVEKYEIRSKPIPTLKGICEKLAAENMVEPRNVLQLLEIADTLGADDLRKHCEDIAIRNVDYIFTVSSHALSSSLLDVLANLEKKLDSRSSEAWSHRRLPTPTATLPAIINSEEEDSDSEFHRNRGHTTRKSSKIEGDHRLDYFSQAKNYPNQDIIKQVRTLKKKLQQIDMLEEKQSKGHTLDDQQIAKVQSRIAVEGFLAELGVPVDKEPEKGSSSLLIDGKGNKKVDVSKKQRRKRKHKVGMESSTSIMDGVPNPEKVFFDNESFQAKHKDEETKLQARSDHQVADETLSFMKNDLEEIPSGKKSLVTSLKKKKIKKGGLSMFLSGALDDKPNKEVPPPPIAKTEGPAWGGVKISKMPSSLRQIQDEQNKILESRSNWTKGQVDDLYDGRSGVKIRLSSLLPSSPIAVVSSRTPHVLDGDNSTPPWAASGTPPLISRPSLRDIQMHQVKTHQSLSHSPKTTTTGFSVASSQVSPSDSAGTNRWFKPEVDTPSSLRAIQIEEKAIKDLKRFYSSVKIVKPF